MLQPQSRDEGGAVSAQLRRGRRGHLPAGDTPQRRCGNTSGWRQDGGRRKAAVSARVRPLLLFPAAAQETWVLVAEKIDSGEKPFLSSRSRGHRGAVMALPGGAAATLAPLEGPQMASRVGGALKS